MLTQRKDMLAQAWAALGGDPAATRLVTEDGALHLLPSVYDVTGLAAAVVGCATLAAAQVHAIRSATPVRAVTVDRRAAALAFTSEALFRPIGWSTPPIWDRIAGDYPAADGWIRLHTNYRHHRVAVERVLGVGDDRAAVAAEVARWPAQRLETAVVEAGGCAAAMHDQTTWLATPAGRAGAREPLARWETGPAQPPAELRQTGRLARPYAGVRVLDLTRVIAGPVATRVLAAYGADVLRIDPPEFEEVPAAVPETSVGKHCAFLDLRDAADRDTFEGLVAQAQVLVTGLRADALGGLGYDGPALRLLNPGLITVRHNAYGWAGPWRDRRGFDSLVQMSCGIAAAGAAAAGTKEPGPLPAQALDHATGYLIAATVGLALQRRLVDGSATDARLSLVGTANLLQRAEVPDGLSQRRPEPRNDDLRDTVTEWGPGRQVPVPGRIEGIAPQWTIPAGPLGRHRAEFSPAPAGG